LTRESNQVAGVGNLQLPQHQEPQLTAQGPHRFRVIAVSLTDTLTQSRVGRMHILTQPLAMPAGADRVAEDLFQKLALFLKQRLSDWQLPLNDPQDMSGDKSLEAQPGIGQARL
jgi:hypothetical protein